MKSESTSKVRVLPFMSIVIRGDMVDDSLVLAFLVLLDIDDAS